MSQHENPRADHDKLETLHEKVNAMLDIPVPKEGDEFPFPVEASSATAPHGEGPAAAACP